MSGTRMARCRVPIAAAIGLCCWVNAAPALAEVVARGPLDHLSVVARGASIAEVLAALCAGRSLHYQTASTLTPTISGTYSGTLHQVVRAVLQDYDYLLLSSGAETEIVVYRRHRPDDDFAAAGDSATPAKNAARNPDGTAQPAVTGEPGARAEPNHVAGILDTLVNNQIAGLAAPSDSPPPSVPTPDQVAELAHRTTAAVESLHAALSRLPQ